MGTIRQGLAVALLVAASAAPLFAQQGTGEITGRAWDDLGAALPGVASVATNEESGQFRDATTSGEGG